MACLGAWTKELRYKAAAYELIIAAPPNVNPALAASIRELMRPWDKFCVLSAAHDMFLVAEAAKIAKGDWLLFTESHCIPSPNALTHLIAVAEAHPEWDGFSAVTEPITHNRLSKAEAELYNSDINAKLSDASWLKVMDQCFLIKASAYRNSGGVQPEYGHFGEWLLAASLKKFEFKLGADLKPVFQHYYIGKMKDLAEFTLDFSFGEIKFKAECSIDDVRGTYFSDIAELNSARERTDADYISMYRLGLRAITSTVQKGSLTPCSLFIETLAWRLKSAFGMRMGNLVLASLNEYFDRLRLIISVTFLDDRAIKSSLTSWFGALVFKARCLYLYENRNISKKIRDPNFPTSSRWSPRASSGAELFSFYGLESNQSTVFCWSKNMAAIFLPLREGFTRVSIEWDATRLLHVNDLILIEFEDKSILSRNVKIYPTSLILDIDCVASGLKKIAWVVTRFHSPGDHRRLGLPVTSIHWAPAIQCVE